MKLNYDTNENFELWCERVRQFELEQARKLIAKGENINLVLEGMCLRIQHKILHPILLELKTNINNNQ